MVDNEAGPIAGIAGHSSWTFVLLGLKPRHNTCSPEPGIFKLASKGTLYDASPTYYGFKICLGVFFLNNFFLYMFSSKLSKCYLSSQTINPLF